MRKVFIIKTTEDGVLQDCFTNIKALFNYLELNQEAYYENGGIDSYHAETVAPLKMNYPNFLKEIRQSQKRNSLYVCRLMSGGYSQMGIDIMELNINSK